MKQSNGKVEAISEWTEYLIGCTEGIFCPTEDLFGWAEVSNGKAAAFACPTEDIN